MDQKRPTKILETQNRSQNFMETRSLRLQAGRGPKVVTQRNMQFRGSCEETSAHFRRKAMENVIVIRKHTRLDRNNQQMGKELHGIGMGESRVY
ncbi:hypothetical protein NPIL_137731 [Nephila pilipes]|uniref:Uncharacterized protein n=1 Tax=Nephila pilipes TaxID=299642 RepID=A0A8X6N266_NEPPI|nr:hypothetical protein NPIL_137731 [Nephila pilipes]